MHDSEITASITERDAKVAFLLRDMRVRSHHLGWIALFNNIDDNDFPLLSISYY